MLRPVVNGAVHAAFWALRTAAAAGAALRRLRGVYGRELAARAPFFARCLHSLQLHTVRFFFSNRWRTAATVTVSIVLALLAYPIVATPFVWPSLDYANERFSGAHVFDATGRWVGLIPGQLDFVGDFSTGPHPSEDHKAVYVAKPPEEWWKVLVSLEDRYMGTPRSIGGIDLGGILRAALFDLPRGKLTGGSSLTMQLYRSMRHYTIGPREPFGHKLQRKFEELAASPVIYRKLGKEGLASWCAMHMPLAIATVSGYGQPAYGIEATARIVFGQPLEELQLSQLAMLAAAVHRPFLLKPTEDGWTVEQASYDRIVARARRGIALAFDENDANTQRALAALDRSEPPQVELEAALRSVLPADDIQAFRNAAHPYRRSLYLARGEMVEAIGRLQEQYGRLWRQHVRGVYLTVDVVENRAFKEGVEDVLAAMDREWSAKLHLRLAPIKGHRPRAQILVAGADQTGRLRRFYSNSWDCIYGGSQWLRDDDGAYQADSEARPVGSVAKAAVALLLADAGASADDMLFNRSVRGGRVRNPNGDRGVPSRRSPGALYTAEQVFARSLNLPLIEALREFDDGELRALARDVGFNLPANEAPSFALPLGRAAASPWRVHLFFHDLGTILYDEGNFTEPPRVVEYVLEQDQSSRVMTQGGYRPSLAPYLDTPTKREFVSTVLGATVRPGGTFHRLSDYAPQRNPAVLHHFAKTGTTTAGPHIRDLYVAGGLVHSRGRITYLVLVGSPVPRDGLGRKISAGMLAPLVRHLFQSMGVDLERGAQS